MLRRAHFCNYYCLDFLSPFGPFRAPLTQARAKLSLGSGHTVIVYVPRACTKKNLERISLITLVFV